MPRNAVLRGIKRLMYKKDIAATEADYGVSIREAHQAYREAIAVARHELEKSLEAAALDIDRVMHRLRDAGDEVSTHPDFVAAHEHMNAIRLAGAKRLADIDDELQSSLEELKRSYMEKMSSWT
ncbi:hypothetical protein SDRG_04561 [Saprolegnia diclina VS20]|uniref:Uncharacterized protein n=1 Tax=Saprolegnia diclina (strain VS20) TaxID=1156394 RepID=T0QTU4_SAPDV|nr:hypothetical protein SDRG_04561 [Saprolegnia diclina VS20]EQC38131.1 hypothetical protein SDRG_04561 [Saprolegnia diclina VS20]|eukprot:XP_008608458.1 hypothetical protein SDRG_04561 [Saprolegnia diclina VS20]